jgi:hypothetical protein
MLAKHARRPGRRSLSEPPAAAADRRGIGFGWLQNAWLQNAFYRYGLTLATSTVEISLFHPFAPPQQRLRLEA